VNHVEILHTVKKTVTTHIKKEGRKTIRFGHILHRNGLLNKFLMKRYRKMNGRSERRSKQLLHNDKENTGNWKLRVEALARALSRTRFGRGSRPVLR
jgi:hypothetical protein